MIWGNDIQYCKEVNHLSKALIYFPVFFPDEYLVCKQGIWAVSEEEI